jgi:4-hydroxy-3-methylbut-2-enyl diphosphate reductase
MQSAIEPCPNLPRTLRIIRATHLGMCFGVRDAIGLALDQARRQPLTILGQLVHNESVVSELLDRGIGIEDQAAEVKTPTVMITAHGASQKTLQRARDQGLRVLEATCPLVRHAHLAVQQLVREGFHLVIIGRRGHVEVCGLTEDLEEFDIVQTEDDVAQLREYPRFGIATQTTQPIAQARQLAQLIQRRFPRSETRFVDTVCQPTKQRQAAAVELARQSDVVVVIGGATSNNTRELVVTCSRYCTRVHHVQTAAELSEDWFLDADTVGITAGTSTPDWIVDEVEERIHQTVQTSGGRGGI